MTCELPRVYNEQTVRARKQHCCCECDKPIMPGTTYVYAKGMWTGGGWVTYKTCLRCNHIKTLALKRYPPDFEEEGPGFGLLYDWIRECRR